MENKREILKRLLKEQKLMGYIRNPENINLKEVATYAFECPRLL